MSDKIKIVWGNLLNYDDVEKGVKKAITASIITAAIVLVVVIGSILAVVAVGRKRKREIEQEQRGQWR